MPISIGTRLGPYEVLEPIGAGGMGEVYRALDTRLNRMVALKISDERFSERFEQEARAVAALNHTNICTLHDVGPNYLVMELVEGETLAERINQGAIPVEEALALASQIADALGAAHEQGIIHRDLKPANIKIKPDGNIKVLDFGLAKIAERSAPRGTSQSVATAIIELTQAGQILGTAAYMSPEQAKGKPVDKRADIWAFGAVLYEMLTGKRAFEGESFGETLAAVLNKEPAIEGVPMKAQRLLKGCLEKDPRQRLHDIADIRFLLDDAAGSPAAAQRHPWRAWALGAVLAATALTLAILHFAEKHPAAETVRFQIPLSAGALNFVLSPDGRRVGFMAPGPDGQTRLWIRALDSLEPHALPGTENVFTPIFWSPDSRFIAFQGEGKLKKIDVSGGPPQTICDTAELSIGGAWSRDGVVIFNSPNGFMQVPASGGNAVQLTETHGAFHVFPTFLPDGRRFIYYSYSPANSGITGMYVGSLDSKPAQQSSKLLVSTPLSGGYAPSANPNVGHLLFMRDGALMVQPFDNRRLEPVGEPLLIVERVGGFRLGANFSVSDNGVLAYRGNAAALSGLTWFDRQGKAVSSVGESATYTDLTLSPDGARAAVTRTDATGEELWLFEFARGVSTRFTFDPTPHMSPVWSPDGSRIAFASTRNGSVGFFEKASSGASNEVTLLQPGGLKVLNDWSHDGRFLLYSQKDSRTKSDLWVLPLNGARTPAPFLQTEFRQRQGQFSPDSHWIAYVSDESGRPEIYVRPFPNPPGGGSKSRVSQAGGEQPRWRRDGKELFYFALNGQLMATDVNTSATFTAGNPKPLFRAPIFSGDDYAPDVFRWDVSADGKRFLIDTTAATSEPITVVLNWTAGLTKPR